MRQKSQIMKTYISIVLESPFPKLSNDGDEQYCSINYASAIQHYLQGNMNSSEYKG